MTEAQAIDCFAALAQTSRLRIVRLLIEQAPNGLPVGEIARRLGILQSTLSSHLGVLRRAGLLTATRHSKEVHYAADLEGLGALIGFFLKDCCHGNVEQCDQVLSLLLAERVA